MFFGPKQVTGQPISKAGEIVSTSCWEELQSHIVKRTQAGRDKNGLVFAMYHPKHVNILLDTIVDLKVLRNFVRITVPV